MLLPQDWRGDKGIPRTLSKPKSFSWSTNNSCPFGATVNRGCNMKTPGCKLQDLTFPRKLTHGSNGKAWGKGRSCLYNNDHIWMTCTVRLAGIEPCTLRRVVRGQRLTDGSKKCGSFIYRVKVFFNYVTLKKDTPRSVEILVISSQHGLTDQKNRMFRNLKLSQWSKSWYPGVLGCDAVLCGRQAATFWGTPLLKSVFVYQSTRRHIPES
jgi:hypothetical protein